MISPAVRLASSAAQRNVDAPRFASMRASLSGLPPSAAMMRAICSAFSSMRCEARSRISARFHAGVQRNASADGARPREYVVGLVQRRGADRRDLGAVPGAAHHHGLAAAVRSAAPSRPGSTRSLTRTRRRFLGDGAHAGLPPAPLAPAPREPGAGCLPAWHLRAHVTGAHCPVSRSRLIAAPEVAAPGIAPARRPGCVRLSVRVAVLAVLDPSLVLRLVAERTPVAQRRRLVAV